MVIRSSTINQCLGRADIRGQGKEFLYILSSVSILFGKVVLPGFQCHVLLFSGSWFYCIYLHAIYE